MRDSPPLPPEALLPLVYTQLRALARERLARERPGQTLQATALVHEVYLRLVNDGRGNAWASRGHFYAAAAEAMRRILVENARRRRSLKRGGERTRLAVDLDGEVGAALDSPDELLVIDETLSRLRELDEEAADLVRLRYFAGLSIGEAAEALNLPRTTAYRRWTFARAWIRAEILGREQPSN